MFRSTVGLRERLTSRGARRWYAGSAFSLIYQIIELVAVWTSHGSLGLRILATIALAIVYAAFVFAVPLALPERAGVRIAVTLVYWALTCLLFPVVGPTTVWVWMLVVAIAAFSLIPVPATIAIVGAVAAAQGIVAAAEGWPDSISAAWFLTLAIGSALIAFSRQIRDNVRLRAAHVEIGRLAAVEERERLARDLHDVLGHSLTVVAVKAELAGRLVETDAARAKAEIDEVADLARVALSELRETVRGFRESDLGAELAAAERALEAVGIRVHVGDASAADPALRAVFGWAVREGTTNVLRHANAHEVWIEIGRDSLRIRDDGTGPESREGREGREGLEGLDAAGTASGSGLAGLRDRVAAQGARLIAGAGADRGFELVVERTVG